LQFFKES